MLMNNLDPEVAERPEDLVVYGGTGKAARNWEAFDAIVRTLRSLGDDETLLDPVGQTGRHLSHARALAPRVLISQLHAGSGLGNLGELSRAGARSGSPCTAR